LAPTKPAIYQFDRISVEVCFDAPGPAVFKAGRVAQPVDGKAILSCKRDPEERFVALQGLQVGASLDESIRGFGFLSGGLKSGKRQLLLLNTSIIDISSFKA